MTGIRFYYFIIFILMTISCQRQQCIEINFKYDNESKMLLIPVIIDSSTHMFNFDTGAAGSIIADSNALGVKINKKDSAIIVWSILDKKIPAYYTFPQSHFILPLKRKVKFLIEPNMGRSVIGTDIIKQLYWWFDLEKKRLKVSNKRFEIDPSNKWLKIPYKYVKGAMAIDVVINDSIKMGEYIFDTGAGRNSADHVPVILMHELKTSKQGEAIESKINKTNITWTQIINDGFDNNRGGVFVCYDTINILGHHFYHCAISIQRNDHMNAKDGLKLVTLGFIRQFSQMYLDTRNNMIYLKP